MKKFIILSFIAVSLFAQNPWKVLTQSTLNEPASKSFFVSEDEGWLGGEDGIIYYTNDGGTSWIIQRDTAETNGNIKDIFFLDNNTGWACAEKGTVLFTTDGGINWNHSSNTSTTENINGIVFVDSNNGYACGNNGVILKSTDGGINWIVQVSNTFANLGGIDFWDVNRGIVYINSNVNGVLYTISGGFVWSVATLPVPSWSLSTRMYGCDAVQGSTQGWVVGYHGLAFKTTNYGSSWQLNTDFYGLAFPYKQTYGVEFVDNQNGYACGGYGWVFKTIDGGSSWDTLYTGSAQTLKSISVLNNQTIVASGNDHQVLKSVDSGLNWQPMVNWPSTSFRSVGIADSSNITIGSHGGDITSSYNAGMSFIYPGNSNIPSKGNTNCVYFINPNLGFIAGQSAEISKSTDGGTTWSAVNVNATESRSIYSLSFINEFTGWAGAHYGIIYKTTDGGDNWTQIKDVGGDLIYDICFLDDNNGFAVTNQGNIFKCTDGDTAWTVKANYPDVDFYGLDFADTTNVYATGDDGIVASSVDGGETWVLSDTLGFVERDSLYLPDLRDITFINSLEGWIVGSYGATFHTTDGGKNWQYIDTNIDKTLYEVELISPTYAYIGGDDGVILRYDPISSIANSNDIPVNAKLKNNYPNPFNPGTNIEYHINISGYVELSIFDVQGKKIKDITNKNQKAGTHKYYWNGKNNDNKLVSSGVYFYQLKIDNEVHVNRMLFIK